MARADLADLLKLNSMPDAAMRRLKSPAQED